MSAYASVDDVRRAVDPDWRLGSGEPASDGDDSAAQLTDEQLNDAIAQASARVDSYIAARYQTPVAPAAGDDPHGYPDPNVRYWTRDLAAYLATLTLFRSAPMSPDEPVSLRMAAALADLTAVRDGKLSLNLPADTSGDASASAGGFSGAVDYGLGSDLFDATDAGYHRRGRYYGYGWPDFS